MGYFSAEHLEYLTANEVRGDILVEMQFASETMRVWNGNTDLVTPDDETWKPLYGAGSVDGLEFSNGTESSRITLALPGFQSDTDLLSIAINEDDETEGRICKLHMVLFDADWQVRVPTVNIFWGYMRRPTVSKSRIKGSEGGVQSIRLGVENIFYNRSQAPAGRFTDRDQQERSPGDLICQFIPGLLFKTWVYPDYTEDNDQGF